jgi:beta-mannosidase
MMRGESIELVFHGVDCIATYWLNGIHIGESDNALIEHRFDISDYINKEGINKLTVRLRSPVIEAMKYEYYPYMSAFPLNWGHLWIRKAPHCYGWDIMPRALSAGLWRSVEIAVYGKHRINDLYFVTREVNSASARMAMYYNISTNPEFFGRLRIVVEAVCDTGRSFAYESKVYFSSGVMEFTVDNPEPWWPRGYGEPELYTVRVKLVLEKEVLCEKTLKIGIRTVELVRNYEEEPGGSNEFLFKINNTNIMCKGSNWVPADVFHSKDAGRYDRMLELVKDLNCNMLRCWGGNVYEDHAFFDFCDQNGIMVWQDFAMACGAYPQDENFLKAIKKEVKSVIKKLRNHPSIVVWCGDNECDYNYVARGIDPGKNKITRKILPETAFENDPYRPFYNTSPYFSSEIAKMGPKGIYFTSEAHLWGARDYYKSRYYTESKACFIGEIGYHGCPNLSSIKKFIDEEYLWPWKDNRQWIIHATSSEGKEGPFSYRIELMANQVKEMFGKIPDNLPDFIIASQITQAEAKKFFIEMSRVKKWERTGVLWWNVIDGWPQFSDAVVDYYFGRKLAYYYIKRVQQPVCIIIDEPESWNVRVAACNDTLKDIDICCRIWDADTGETLFKGEKCIKANENSLMGRINISRGEQRLFLIEWECEGRKYSNHYLHGQPPFSLDDYIKWLDKIASLDNAFDVSTIGK